MPPVEHDGGLIGASSGSGAGRGGVLAQRRRDTETGALGNVTTGSGSPRVSPRTLAPVPGLHRENVGRVRRDSAAAAPRM